jgi:hypothetical protein
MSCQMKLATAQAPHQDQHGGTNTWGKATDRSKLKSRLCHLPLLSIFNISELSFLICTMQTAILNLRVLLWRLSEAWTRVKHDTQDQLSPHSDLSSQNLTSVCKSGHTRVIGKRTLMIGLPEFALISSLTAIPQMTLGL